MNRSIKILLFVCLGVFLTVTRFLFLGNNDLLSDDALYSFRSLGWLDFIGGGQTTPIQWFGEIPWWANLSFHDGPPLVPFFQYIFFSIFGDSTFVARLPFALAGVGTVILIYFILKDYSKNHYLAFLGAFVAAASSYMTWASRVGYLEGVQIFFITLSLFLFLRYVIYKDERYLYIWGVAAGLALMSKYTALFILPAAFFYFIFWDRKVFFKKEIWLAGLLILVILTPVIIYNFNVFTARGHFDAALSSMVGIQHEDFVTIAGRSASFSIINIQALIKVFLRNSSMLFVFLLIFSLGYVFYQTYRKKEIWGWILLVHLFFAILMFCVMGAETRFLSILMPFFIIIGPIFTFNLLMRRQQNLLYFYFLLPLVGLIFVTEAFYNINTNLTFKPIGSELFYSKSRFYSKGFNQLDGYIKNNVGLANLTVQRPENFNRLSYSLNHNNFWLFDERIDWFAYSWYLQKYIFYYRLPMVSSYNYLASLSDEDRQTDVFNYLRKNKFDGVYYIYAVDQKVLDSKKSKLEGLEDIMGQLAGIFINNNAKITEIKNNQGELAFRVYYLRFNQ